MVDTETTNSYLQWLRKDSEAAPFMKHLGMEFERFEKGDVLIRLPIKNELLNANGVLHGGVISTLLDHISGVTIRSTREARVATISLTTQFIAPVKGGILYASAALINHGNRIQNVEAKVTNEKGEIVGTALVTFAILK